MYILFYFLLGLIVPLALCNDQERKIRFLGYDWNVPILMAVTFVVLIRSFAYNTGTDYLAYYKHYFYVAHGLRDYWGEHREIGYQWLVALLAKISDHPQLFFGVSAFIFTYSVLKISRLFGKPERFILLLWPLFMFILSYNLYRQYIAISLLLLAICYYVNGKKIKMGIAFVVSFLFHTSAVVGIAVIIGVWFYRNRVIKINYLLIALGITTVLSSKVSLILSKLADIFSIFYFYVTGKIYSSDDIIRSMYETSSLLYINSLAYGIFIWYGHKLCEKYPKYLFFFYMFSLACILEPITRQEILMRLWLYIQAFTPIFLGILFYNYRNVQKYPILWGALGYKVLYYLYALNTLGNLHPLIFKF